MRPVAGPLLEWYDRNRRSFAFRGTRDPYRVWLSEIMLQQTRTETAEPYYLRFLKAFPDVSALAAAPEEDVLRQWAGLGYYSRARNLLKTARIVADTYGGQFPSAAAELEKLPGVGAYTAAAIASIAFGEAIPAMDGNLLRVFSRLYSEPVNIDTPEGRRALTARARADISAGRPGDFNQAVMDLGATVCIPGTPHCEKCPLQELCEAFKAGTADLLPVRDEKKAPRPVWLDVFIVTDGQRVLVTRRRERLLEGLWVFPMAQPGVLSPFGRETLDAAPRQKLCTARHVFTHLVWNMTLWHIENREHIVPHGMRAVDAEELTALPRPGAHRAAYEEAMKMIGGRQAF